MQRQGVALRLKCCAGDALRRGRAVPLRVHGAGPVLLCVFGDDGDFCRVQPGMTDYSGFWHGYCLRIVVR